MKRRRNYVPPTPPVSPPRQHPFMCPWPIIGWFDMAIAAFAK